MAGMSVRLRVTPISPSVAMQTQQRKWVRKIAHSANQCTSLQTSQRMESHCYNHEAVVWMQISKRHNEPGSK